MDVEVTVVSLVQYLLDWFNNQPKTQINDRFKHQAITFNGEWIFINVESINTNYASYFKPDLFYKNSDLLSKKLVEVVKHWMKANEIPVYHLKFKIVKHQAEFPRQGLIRI